MQREGLSLALGVTPLHTMASGTYFGLSGTGRRSRAEGQMLADDDCDGDDDDEFA